MSRTLVRNGTMATRVVVEDEGMTTNIRPVVVGVDGSVSSWQAVHAAAWEAQQRKAKVVLVHGYPDYYPYVGYGWAVTPAYDAEAPAAAMVEETANRVRGYYPDLDVSTLLRAGTGAQVLIDASHSAALVVVGARGQGGFGGLSIGSVAAQTAAHATAPVMVIRPSKVDSEAADVTAPVGPIPHPGPVMVGVDGSVGTDVTIEFAFEAAARRGVPLVALHVWWALPKHNLGPDLPGHYDYGAAQQEARRLLAELMAGWQSKFPDVPLELRAVQSMNPSYTLIEASAQAGLVVVGSRGRGGFAGLLLGSVGRDLVGHASSPVTIVHPARTVPA
jgi:nucleotide-binding universal stress UspA family protein